MGSILETTADAIRISFQGLRGPIHVTFEEGTHSAWLYEVIRPLVAEGSGPHAVKQ